MSGIKFKLLLMVKMLISILMQVRGILKYSNLHIGRSVLIDRHTAFADHVFVNDNCRLFNVRIGSYSYVSPYGILINVNIGRYCSIGPGVKIGTGTHPMSLLSTSPHYYNQTLTGGGTISDFQETVIGDDVWIGSNTVIFSGVKIGSGAVIAAGSIVRKDVMENEIVGGVPAKHIKWRLSLDKFEIYKALGWWDKTPDELKGIKL